MYIYIYIYRYALYPVSKSGVAVIQRNDWKYNYANHGLIFTPCFFVTHSFADLDLVCVVPEFAVRTDFFSLSSFITLLIQGLESKYARGSDGGGTGGKVSNVLLLTKTYVPLIRLTFQVQVGEL